MPSSFVPVPSVRDRVNEAFGLMSLAPERYKHFYSFLLFSFSEGFGFDGDGSRARRHDALIAPRLENIVRAVKEAILLSGSRIPSEELLAAISQRDTLDYGLKGTAMLMKYPEASAFVYGIKHIYSGFKRVSDEPIPSLQAYRSVGPDAQFLVQFHALDTARRALLKIGNPDVNMSLVDQTLSMSGVNRYRPLMSAIDSVMSKRFFSLTGSLDACLQAQNTPDIEGGPGGEKVVSLSHYRRVRQRRLVKT